VPNTDNILPTILQTLQSRAYPSALPSNQVLILIESPTDPVAIGEACVASATQATACVWGGATVFSAWQECALSGTTASLRPGSLTLLSTSTSGTALTPAVAVAPGVPPAGAEVTFYAEALLPDSGDSATYQVRFSPDGTTWGAYAGMVSGQTAAVGGRYAQVLVTLGSAAAGLTPQVGTLTFAVASPWRWDVNGLWDA
jgi:hypothetical protein